MRPSRGSTTRDQGVYACTENFIDVYRGDWHNGRLESLCGVTAIAKKTAPVVAVLNMKGGVGKTTVTANLFRSVFSELSLKTLLVDFDPQFNLTQALITEEDYTKLEKSNKTIIAAMESPPLKTSSCRARDRPSRFIRNRHE